MGNILVALENDDGILSGNRQQETHNANII
jgi:hypothetical protein